MFKSFKRAGTPKKFFHWALKEPKPGNSPYFFFWPTRMFCVPSVGRAAFGCLVLVFFFIQKYISKFLEIYFRGESRTEIRKIDQGALVFTSRPIQICFQTIYRFTTSIGIIDKLDGLKSLGCECVGQ